MILGSQVIITAYGFWLPNDPRGSWSDFVGAWELLRFGRATRVHARAWQADPPHDASARLAAKEKLKYPAVHFSGVQARAIGRACAEVASKHDLGVWACAILPEHTHLVLARHRLWIEDLGNLLKGQTTRQWVAEGIHPLAGLPTRTGRCPKAWARGHWKVFPDSEAGVREAIQYVRGNPMKEDKPPQKWSFVRPGRGWVGAAARTAPIGGLLPSRSRGRRARLGCAEGARGVGRGVRAALWVAARQEEPAS